MDSDHPLTHYSALAAKVDRHFAAIQARAGALMQCGSGCTDCCHTRLSVTLVEAFVIAETVLALPDETRRRLTEQADSGDPGICAALGPDGQCAIYPARPLVCRSHGAPIRRPAAGAEVPAGGPSVDAHGSAERVRLPVLEACPRNFAGGDRLSEMETEMTFDQVTLSTVLGAVDAGFADACGAPRGLRIELADLVGHPERHFDLDEPT